MKKLLLIDACIRKEDSRTKRIAEALVDALSEQYTLETIDLTATSLKALDAEGYLRRQSGESDPVALAYARQLADADLVIAALPFWDMSFPAVFKVLCEQITINGITFHTKEGGTFVGGCRAKKMLLVTSRGAQIEDGTPMEQGSSYLRAIGLLWGIPEVHTVSAIGMDVVDEDTREARIKDAIARGRVLCCSL